MSRAVVNEKKLAILQVVKEKRNILFASCQNNPVRKQEKEEAWKLVLKKAQSLGLASADRGWIYARDHIFGLWKSRTLAKGDTAHKTAIDLAILDILGTSVSTVDGSELSEADRIEFKEEIPEIHDQQDCPLDSAVFKPENLELQDEPEFSLDGVEFKPEISELHEHQYLHPPKPRNIRGGNKRKWDKSDSVNFLKKQVLKSELYKNKLLILQLERQLGLPLSKFTYDLQNQR